MPNVPLSVAVAQLGRVFLTSEPDATDGELLTRFVRSRDEAAFAELVRRLGPIVLGVCRRVTADTHLAEDAFQAAFLVLARRAADIHPREAVRGWLYGVAARTAQKARVMSLRRRTREVPTHTLPDCPASPRDEADPDVLRALDEEIAALSDHLRVAVVLCELDGLSRKDAAVRLGIHEGTLSSRLAKARHVLAERLRRRGICWAREVTVEVSQAGSRITARKGLQKMSRISIVCSFLSAFLNVSLASLFHTGLSFHPHRSHRARSLPFPSSVTRSKIERSSHSTSSPSPRSAIFS
jgi:RNA polymerase sigma factor (sigma-70 family)